ncbi:hypothetical protein Misp02_01690 [Microtetraspora sp. NBRC 16547]|nr:hypothetical protein Misp02_01690 [Microtetraspora sp. NBRC 16547]
MAEFRLTAAPLVTLSACHTADIGGTAPDEVIGMPSAFLRAGASGVVGSLWAVADDSTALLMEEMYSRLRRSGEGQGAALRSAQAWLRDGTLAELRPRLPANRPGTGESLPGDLRPFEHPYYWAAFQHVGMPTSTG